MCGGLAGQELPDVVLCEIERYFAVIGVNDGWNIALPHIVPHIADVRRGAFLKIPRRIDPSGEEPLCDQIENTGAADALRRKIADRLIPQAIVGADFDAADRARLGAHAGFADSALKRGPGSPGSHE